MPKNTFRHESVRKNFAYQMVYEVLALILPLITSPYISRVLGAAGVGVYSYTYTIANYFVMFAALGIKNYGNREIARNRDDKEKLDETFSSLFYLHVIVSSIVLIGYIVYVFCFAGEYRTYAMTQSLYVIGAVLDITWLFNGLEFFKVTVIRNSLIKIATVLCVFVFVKNADDVWKYVLILALGSFLSQVYLWTFVPRLVKFRKVPFSSVVGHLPQLFILFIPTVAISLYNYMDKIMVGAISGDVQLGLYENSEKIISVVFSIIAAFGTVMMPRMSNMVANGDTEGQKRSIESSMQVVLFIAFALAFGLVGISGVFPQVFWGREFSDCSILMALLSIIIPIKAYAQVLRTQYLIPNKMDKAYTISVCLGAVVNIIINALLIGRLGALGAVVGTVFAELTVCIVQAVYCAKHLPVFSYLKHNAFFLVLGALMSAVVYIAGKLLGSGVLTLSIQIVIGVVIYCAGCLIYFKITNNRLFLDTLDSVLHKVFKRR